MIYLAVVLNLAALTLAEVCRDKEDDVVRAIVIALTKFVLLFCVINLCLFGIDHFRYKYALIIEYLISTIYCVVIYISGRKRPHFKIDWKNLLIPLLICIISISFTVQKAEMFHMGQDEGVYQTEAISLATGHTSVYCSFDEYDLLTDDFEKAQYLDYLDDLTGYYRLEDTLDRPEYANKTAVYDVKNETAGVYHGIHNFSSLMGLWMLLFGMENMLGVIGLIYFCNIFLFFYSLRNLKVKLYISGIATLIFSFSPLILWLSKTAYSEMVFILAVNLYLYYLTLSDKKIEGILSLGMATVYMAFSHIMFLVLYPAFWLINIVKAVRGGEKRYLYNNIFMAAGTIAFYIITAQTSLYYLFYNLGRLYRDYITIDNVLYWIAAGAMISAIVSWPLYIIFDKYNVKKISRLFVNAGRIIAAISLIYVVAHFYNLGHGCVEQSFYNSIITNVWGSGKQALFHSSLWALICFSGVLVFPCSVIFALKGKKKSECTPLGVSLLILYIWFVFVYSSVFKADVWYYFYYARYLGYVIPVVILYFTYMTSCIESECWSKIVGIGFPVISLALMLILDVPVAKYKDDTVMEWYALQTIAEQVGSDDALIISQPLQLGYALPLDSLTGAGTFPAFEDLDAEEELLRKNYDNVYILCGADEADALQASSVAKLTVIANVDNTSSYNRLYFIDGFRFENYTEKSEIILYKCE